MQNPPHPSDGDPAMWRVYWTPELLAQVLQACNWPTLMAISRANHYGRELVRMVVRDRMRYLLNPFICTPDSTNNFLAFMDTLNRTGGGVLGSIARRLLAVNAPFLQHTNEHSTKKYDSSFDLNIVVPFGMIDQMMEWFRENGLGDWRYRSPSYGYRRNIVSFVTGRKGAGADKASLCAL